MIDYDQYSLCRLHLPTGTDYMHPMQYIQSYQVFGSVQKLVSQSRKSFFPT